MTVYLNFLCPAG